MNKFIFLGRLGKDPEVRFTPTTNTQVSNFSLAVARKMAGPNGERQTDFFNLTSFGKIAEFVSKYFRKGQQVLVEGRLQNRTWEDDTGAKRYIIDFIVEHCDFAGESKQSSKTSEVDGEYITIDDSADLPF
jgi:single-strand DNA-binding protein